MDRDFILAGVLQVVMLFMFFSLLTLVGCTHGGRRTGATNFEAQFEQFLADPTAQRLGQMERTFRATEPGHDEFLVSMAFERGLDDRWLPRLNQAFEKDPVLTFQALFLLAFEVPTWTKFTPVHETYAKILQTREQEPTHPHTSILTYLGAQAALKSPEALMTAIEQSWPGMVPGQRVRLIQGVADFGLDQSAFRAEGFSSRGAFFKAKRLELRKALEKMKGPERQEIARMMTSTRLFQMGVKIMPEFKRLIQNPTEVALQRLRKACQTRASDEPAPSLDDLTEGEYQDALAHLSNGDLYMARASVVMAQTGCVRESEQRAGPQAWLGNRLLCSYPEVLIESFSEENASDQQMRKIVEVEKGGLASRCQDLNPRLARQKPLFRKLDLLSRIQTQNALEEEKLLSLLNHYKVARSRAAGEEGDTGVNGDADPDPAAGSNLHE